MHWSLHAGAVIAVAFTSAIVYSGAFNAGFVWDDRAAIVGNPDVTGVNPWWELFEHDFWGQSIGASDSHKSFRPITTATFRLQYYFSGGDLSLVAASMHQANVWLHALASISICALGPAVGLHPVSSLLAAVVFSVHPVHVDAVASLVGRAELLCCLLFVSAIIAYRASQTAADRAAASESQSLLGSLRTRVLGSLTLLSVMLCVAATALACAAALCKEIGITAFAVFLAMEACTADDLSPQAAPGAGETIATDDNSTALSKKQRQRARKQQQGAGFADSGAVRAVGDEVTVSGAAKRQTAADWLLGGLYRREALARILVSAALVAGFLVWRLGRHAGAPAYRWRPLENRLAHLPPSLALCLSISHTHARSLALLLWPTVLSFDHGLGCHPLVLAITDARNLDSIAAYAFLAGLLLAAVSLRRRAGVLGLAVFAASYAPASNVLVFVGLEVAERVLYIPSLGLAIAILDTVPAALGAIVDGRAATAVAGALGCDKAAVPALVGQAGADATPRSVDPPPAQGRDSPWGRRLWLALLSVVVGRFALRTVQYVPAWTDEEALFAAGVEACPRGVKAGNNLAYLWASRPDPLPLRNRTEGLLRSAIAVWPHHASAYLNLALLWSKAGLPPDTAARSRDSAAPAEHLCDWACGPEQVDGVAAAARRLGALTGDDAAIGLLWTSLTALHQTPAPAVAWLARYYLTRAASRDLAPLPFSPEAAERALQAGLPLGSLWRKPGATPVPLTERDTELGGGAMRIWVGRFVLGGDRHASSTLVKEGTPLDHGIVTGDGFGWLARHQLPYPPHYSPEAARFLQKQVTAAALGLRLVEEATDAGSTGYETLRWRAVAAATSGQMDAAAAEARRCVAEWGQEHGAQIRTASHSAIVPGAVGSPDKLVLTSCQLLLAGSLLEQEAQPAESVRAEVSAILDSVLAGKDAAALSNLGGELRQYGMAELSVVVTRRALQSAVGSPQEAAVANNHGYALELAGRPGEALQAYEAAIGVAEASVAGILRANTARASGTFQQTKVYQEALQRRAVESAQEVEVDAGGALV